ncbi:hypothetical protein ZWY2020_003522 [Hordeum vulgare]|nr:hypothetical protein ZWY2020_003522 [Hordeum vulgare]
MPGQLATTGPPNHPAAMPSPHTAWEGMHAARSIEGAEDGVPDLPHGPPSAPDSPTHAGGGGSVSPPLFQRRVRDSEVELHQYPAVTDGVSDNE